MPKKKSGGPGTALEASKPVLQSIQSSAREIKGKIMARKKPTMKFPVRSLTNVKYHPQRGFFEIAGQKNESRPAKKHGVPPF